MLGMFEVSAKLSRNETENCRIAQNVCRNEAEIASTFAFVATTSRLSNNIFFPVDLVSLFHSCESDNVY